ncbi:MAG: Rpn family recombination-promoting nuclease/putative transposase [Leptospirales bacterium]|nr:Rpn family recombination-promoting nuclease/putative transposase [Leptospirales bacterium]
MTVNKKYKDSLFRSIFNNEERLLELYNAIEGTDYRDAQAIDINTLEDIIYIGMKNDISFIIDDTLVLIEHQSTINENMPLRMGIYLFLIWRKITNADPMAKYGRYSREIPNPKLIVLYNGKEEHPAEKTLWLYPLYKKKNVEKKIVDLEVKVLNINKGYNPELERRSKTLADYATFITKVREYEKEYRLEEAIRLAIKYCIDNDILKEYLKQNSSEVNSMLTTEFDLDEYTEVIRMETKERALAEGQNYVLELMAQGLSYEEIKKKIEELPKK